MSLRDIMVVLGGSARDEAVLAVATDLAQRHEAHLIGFCPLDFLLPVNRGFAMGGYPDVIGLQEVADQLEAKAVNEAERIEAMFREALRRNGLPGEWQAASGTPAKLVAQRARMTDLLVLGQPDPDSELSASARDLVEDVLMTCGRPMLIVPYAGKYETVGTNVLLGWSGTRESARAIHDALPVLAPAARLTVLTVQRASSTSDSSDIPAAGIAEHLARHEFQVSAARTFADGSIADSDAILAYAFDIGADLLVVGGYGHSRTRELIMGGVTRELLLHMTVPVLMSH